MRQNEGQGLRGIRHCGGAEERLLSEMREGFV